jgi:hypothetical protein
MLLLKVLYSYLIKIKFTVDINCSFTMIWEFFEFLDLQE